MNIPILTYHQVTPRPLPGLEKYCLTPQAFSRQMSWLALRTYTPVTLDQLLAYRKGQGILPERPVVITFDDGYQDLIQFALPSLEKHSFTAIFFLVAGLIGRTTEWEAKRVPLMDWAEARQLVIRGFQIGAHSLNHAHLDQIPAEKVDKELNGARQVIEEELNLAIRHLAYPYGGYTQAVQSIAVQAGYDTACSVRVGLSSPEDDIYALHRIPLYAHDSLLDFSIKLRTARNLRKTVSLVLSSWQQSVVRRMRNI